jgi:hypothetical protein
MHIGAPPPPPPGGPPAPWVPENTSGRGKGTQVPPEALRWNWGAFWLTWIWGLGNRVWISLLAFVPFGVIVMPFVLGATGSQRAWQKKRWQSLEHFRRVQRRWAIAGWIWIGVVAAGIAASAVIVNGPSDPPRAEQVLSSENGDLQIAVPSSWDYLTGELNEVASIEAGNPLEDAYVIVIEEFKADFADEMSLSRFAKVTTSQMSASLEAGRVTEGPVSQSIRSSHALRHVIEGTLDGLNVTYMHVSIETPTRLLQA